MQPRKNTRTSPAWIKVPLYCPWPESRDKSVPWSRAPRLVRVAASAADCGPSLLAPRSAELWRRGASRAPGKRRLALHTAEDLPAGKSTKRAGWANVAGWTAAASSLARRRGRRFSKETGAALRLSGGWGGGTRPRGAGACLGACLAALFPPARRAALARPAPRATGGAPPDWGAGFSLGFGLGFRLGLGLRLSLGLGLRDGRRASWPAQGGRGAGGGGQPPTFPRAAPLPSR